MFNLIFKIRGFPILPLTYLRMKVYLMLSVGIRWGRLCGCLFQVLCWHDYTQTLYSGNENIFWYIDQWMNWSDSLVKWMNRWMNEFMPQNKPGVENASSSARFLHLFGKKSHLLHEGERTARWSNLAGPFSPSGIKKKKTNIPHYED